MLVPLQREIDARTHEIAVSHGAWPCRPGCDSCCRNLSEPPRFTRVEWESVAEGMAHLPASTVATVRTRAGHPSRVCPFLDPDAGRCLIYEHRPVACRTYGFYIERDRGLYCKEIEQRVAAGEMANVVWGNVAGVESTLQQLGEKIALNDWLRELPAPVPTPSSDSPDPDAGR